MLVADCASQLIVHPRMSASTIMIKETVEADADMGYDP